MIFIFALVAFVAAVLATAFRDLRRAILSVWGVGLAVGAIYLTVGAEFLAVVQWIISTLITISFVFFSVMFGEYGSKKGVTEKGAAVRSWIFSMMIGVGFSALVALAAWNIGDHSLQVDTVASGDLGTMGMLLAKNHLIALEVLAATLFLCIVGAGSVARSEQSTEVRKAVEK